MSCDTRHLENFLPASPTPEDERALDGAVRVYLGMPDADRPEVWAAMREND